MTKVLFDNNDKLLVPLLDESLMQMTNIIMDLFMLSWL